MSFFASYNTDMAYLGGNKVHREYGALAQVCYA